MKENSLNNKIFNAAKWSSITEIIAKLIVPITNMLLARILSPGAFGVVATINMIISFTDMFTDAGFQKYIVQHEFKSKEEKIISTNVAFWTNLIISIILWGIIVIFSDNIAIMVGNEGLGHVIALSCIQLPLTSFSSIQMSVYRRNLDFKTLFLVRLIGILIPFVITIPLAYLEYGYWSIIIGNIIGTISNAVVLTIKSEWKPSFTYKISTLKEMLSFSIWSLIESVSIWLTSWVDTFIIGGILSSYFLGLYKTAASTVNSIFSLVTGSTTPILFSTLSRFQNDENEFRKMFFYMQKIVAYLVFPMSIGIFVYRDLITNILLGEQWIDASNIVGIWSITSGIVIVLGHYSSEVYRAKGKPRLSFIAQILHLIVLIPACIIASKFGFTMLVNIRAIIRIQLVLVHLLIMHFVIKISICKMLKNISVPFISSCIMGIFGMFINRFNNNILWQIVGILLCIILYFIMLMSFKSSRKDISIIIDKLNIKQKKIVRI